MQMIHALVKTQQKYPPFAIFDLSSKF